MKMIKRISVCTLCLIFLVMPIVAFSDKGATPPAGATPSPITAVITNPIKGANDLTSLITLVLKNIIMPIASVFVVVYIIWAGFSFVIAQGKPAEIEKAKKRLLWSLIGAGILLGATAISAVVQKTVQSLMN